MKTRFFASHYRPPVALHRLFNKAILLSTLLSCLAPASANEAADISRLLRGKQYVEALAKTDAVLSKHPRDAQMRFYKGLILADQNKSAEAIVIFSKLIDDFPDLPEPYNNLAVLYGASGQYEKASATLDMAIRTNSTYATALANLGDVYERLASQAYEKALQLEPGKTPPVSKLTLVRTLAGNGSGGAVPKLSIIPAPVAPAIAKPEPLQPAKPAELPPLAALPMGKPPEKAISKPVQSTVPTVAPPAAPAALEKPQDKAASTTAKPIDKSTEKVEANRSEQERNDVLAHVNSWAKAWSSKDVKGYLAQYDADFAPPKGLSRKAWVEERRVRIEEKGRISVRIENPSVTIKGNTATVRFRQIYESDKLKIRATKTLVLTRQGSRWAIVQERAGG